MPPNPKASKFKDKVPASFSSDRFISELKSLIDGMEPSFKRDYQSSEMMTKYVDPTTTPAEVRANAAVQKWLRVERNNFKTNQRIMLGYNPKGTHDPYEVDFGWTTASRLLDDVRELVAKVLGPLGDPAELLQGTHTNGASTRVRRSAKAAVGKLVGEADISSTAVKHWIATFTGSRLSIQTLQLQESSALFTVPKTSDIDRVAAKEPECNMLLQRAVGNHIRRRLRRFGIDLNDQTVNQELARTGVRDELATIDLSSASDSITRSLVMHTLPLEWWSLLDDLRVHSTILPDGSVHEMNMFSSMGNGFTFELESLLFYAITRVVCWRSRIRGRISVYGDDIIAPCAIVPRLKRVFHWLGFTMNPKKTSASGLFRESCGKHFHNGVDVTPFYIRREVVTHLDLVNHLNHLLEWDGRGLGFFTTEEAYRFWVKWSKFVPRILWGGIHPEDPTCLVTGHAPRSRMVPRMKGSRLQHRKGQKVLIWSQDEEDASFMLWLLTKPHSESLEENKYFRLYNAWDTCIPRTDLDKTIPGTLAIDPREQVGVTLRRVISRGERTTWDPGAIFRTW